jgi:hypothetical protein
MNAIDEVLIIKWVVGLPIPKTNIIYLSCAAFKEIFTIFCEVYCAFVTELDAINKLFRKKYPRYFQSTEKTKEK